MADRDLASIQEARDLVTKARAAQQQFARLTQQQVDQAIQAIAKVMTAMAEDLAAMAVEETGFGNVDDKIKKNLLASEKLFERIHCSNRIGIGMGRAAASLGGIDGSERITPHGLADGLMSGTRVSVRVQKDDDSFFFFGAVVRLDNGMEVEYYRHGGILHEGSSSDPTR